MIEVILIIITIGILIDIYIRFRYHKRNILLFFDDLEKRTDERLSMLERRVRDLEAGRNEKRDMMDEDITSSSNWP